MSKTTHLAEAIVDLATHGRLGEESSTRLQAIIEDKNLDELENEMMARASELINENDDDDDVKAQPKKQAGKQVRR